MTFEVDDKKRFFSLTCLSIVLINSYVIKIARFQSIDFNQGRAIVFCKGVSRTRAF